MKKLFHLCTDVVVATSCERVIAPYPPENKDGFAILFSLYEMRLRISAKKTGFLGSGDNGAITHKMDSAGKINHGLAH